MLQGRIFQVRTQYRDDSRQIVFDRSLVHACYGLLEMRPFMLA